MKKQKIELLILAAGLGSRYKGLKQMDSFGPNGETLMEFSLYDAIQAGFDRVVFVIKEDFAGIFQEKIVQKYQHLIEVDVVFQEMSDLPPLTGGTANPEKREKPWGTGHAVWAARKSIQNPFAVINADDFYGASGYLALAGFLREQDVKSTQFAMVGYPLEKTLSSHGTVNRGVIEVLGGSAEAGIDGGLMQSVVEREKISLQKGTPQALGQAGEVIQLQMDDLVSMNFWGFTPAVFSLLEDGFTQFLLEHGRDIKTEFYLPTLLDQAVSQQKATVQVLTSDDEWIGVTYPEDKQFAIDKIKKLLGVGSYPMPLVK